MKKKLGLLLAAGMLTVSLAGCATQIDKGKSLLEDKKYEEAVKDFQKATETPSMEKEAYRGLGISYFELKQYKKAASALQTALDKGAEKTPEIYNLLGISYMKSKQYEKSAENFEAGIQMDGAGETLKKEMSYNQIFVLEKAEKYNEAREKAEEYLKNWPDDEDVKKEVEFLKTQAGNQ